MTSRPLPGVSLAKLRSGSEFDRIRAILGDVAGLEAASGRAGLSVGPGDDAAVLGDLVLSTDLTIEDVHFRRHWIGLEALGRRAVSVALSDVGAMGGRPVAVLWSLALADPELDSVVALGEGVRSATAAAGAVLAGGDLSRSPGPLVLDVVAVGRTRDPVLRSTAAPGDDLWVSGTLGGAAAAVEAWEEGRVPAPSLRRRFQRPDPPLHLLRELRREGSVTAGIDVSDGLLADAGHLAAASGVRIRVLEERVPVDPGLLGLPSARRRRLALTGGEDYEVLFTAPRESRARLEARPGERTRIRRIGEVTEGSGVVSVGTDDVERTVDHAGFDHFAGGGA